MDKKKRTPGVALTEGFLRLNGRLPLGYHYFWGRVFAWLMRSVLHYRSDVVMTNLARSFPDKKYGELKAISKRFYAHLGDIIAEAVWFAGCRGERGVRRFRKQGLVEFTNPEVINRIYAAGSSAVVMSSHAGNWELLGCFISAGPGEPVQVAAKDMHVVYKRLSSDFWDAVMGDNRCSLVAHTDFDGYVESRSVLRSAVMRRGEPSVYVFPTDQYPYKGAASYDIGTFLCQDTKALAGGAALASRFGMAVVYMRWEAVERGKYRVTFVPVSDDASGEEPASLMRKFYDLLEQDIAACPHNYLWTHKRWK